MAWFISPRAFSGPIEIAVAKGLFPKPQRFEDWGELDVAHPNLPHLTPDYLATVRSFLQYLLLAYPGRYHRDSALGRVLGHPLGRLLYEPWRRAALWRVERQAFRFPLEARLYQSMQSLRARRLSSVYDSTSFLSSRLVVTLMKS